MSQDVIHYQPTCDLKAMRARAQMYSQIRQFFAEREVLEVETPILSQAGVTDVHLASVQAQRHLQGKQQTHYLQTSPEFAMKRLLASGSGPIYQICKVFRDDEHGRKHNSEFTMLEWYRPNFSLKDLMFEVTDLLNVTLKQRFGEVRPTILSYKHAFMDRLDLNPLQASLKELKDCCNRVGLNLDLGDDRLGYIDLLFSHFVEPSLGFDTPVFLTDFPPELASLANYALDVRFAVLVHDLGKALTPVDELPRHIMHEERGVKPVTEVCERLKVPTQMKQLAITVCKEHLKCHQALTLKPGTLWRLLQRLDVLRRPERVEAFVQACECDSRGRLGLEDREYPQSAYILKVMDVVRNIKAQDLPADIKGPDIGEMLIERRIHAIGELKAQYS